MINLLFNYYVVRAILFSASGVVSMCTILYLFGSLTGLVHYEITFQFIAGWIVMFTMMLLGTLYTDSEMEREWTAKKQSK